MANFGIGPLARRPRKKQIGLSVPERPIVIFRADARRQAPRRSASQVPEHSPPFQEPTPAVPERRPEPVALLFPALTVTVTAPLLATLPVMVAGLEPSASTAPLWMRIG